MPDGGRVRTFTDVTDYLSTVEALRQSEAQARAFASGATLVSQTVTPLPSPPAPSNASMAVGAAQ